MNINVSKYHEMIQLNFLYYSNVFCTVLSFKKLLVFFYLNYCNILAFHVHY